jgi:hypothetical protein
MRACRSSVFLCELALLCLVALMVPISASTPARGCCPAGRVKKGIISGAPVVNADQAVIILWDAANKTQHFIRRASFKSEGDDFGFLVPTPSQPELAESGNDTFPFLQKLTEPEHQKVKAPSGGGGMGCGCSKSERAGSAAPQVRVLEEKVVADLHAAVLETNSAEALVEWLGRHSYAYSPEVAAWARPYVAAGWKFTAMKVAKEEKGKVGVGASALRMTFRTERPLFPYREPDSASAADSLGARSRLLRIYFLAEARYGGAVEKGDAFGKVAWANKLSATDRKRALELLNLPQNTGPAEWWMTEFEHDWPYRVAPGDVYFSPAASQDTVKRPPIIEYVAVPANRTDVMAFALVGVIGLLPVLRRLRRRCAARG